MHIETRSCAVAPSLVEADDDYDPDEGPDVWAFFSSFCYSLAMVLIAFTRVWQSIPNIAVDEQGSRPTASFGDSSSSWQVVKTLQLVGGLFNGTLLCHESL